MSPDVLAGRRDELADALAAVRARIDDAARDAGRDSAEVTLVVVTKHFPASDVRLLHGLGVTDVGENRHQEAAAKREACDGLPLRWHFVGHLQSNKGAAVAGWADAVHSVDRERVLAGLARGAADRDEELDVLVQVDLDAAGPAQASGRSGAAPEAVPALAAAVAAGAGLRLRGVMGVAPLGGDPPAAFRLLADVAAEVRAVDPAATWVSAGMSGDLEAAVAAGATHVRVGTAVLGNRPAPG